MTDYKTFIKSFDKEHPQFVDKDGNHRLQNAWVMWSHAPTSKCNKWDISSYVRHTTIRTVEEFWSIFNGFPSLVNEDMWFLMRDGIPPLWEDPINAQGGSFKFKVSGDKIDNTWLTLALFLVTENMCIKERDAMLISGISVSPKQHNFSTVSIWNLDSAATDHTQFPGNIEGIDFFKMSLYQPHSDRKRG